jgi:hypothetical protein
MCVAWWWCGVDVGVIYITAQLETPREGYDEHSSKSSLSMKQWFIEPVGERTKLLKVDARSLCDSSGQLRQKTCPGCSFAPAAT